MADLLHIIGDSHTFMFCADGSEGFSVHHLGPILAYTLARPSVGRDKFFAALAQVPKGARVMTVFGEIDCRAHIYLQAKKQKRKMVDLAHECALRYAGVLKEAEMLGYRILAWSVIPPSNMRVTSKKWPAAGTLKERRAIVRAFNATLSAHCRTVRINDDLVDANEAARHEYYLDAIHLSEKALPLARAAIERALVCP